MTCSTSGNVYAATFAANPGLMSVGQGVTVAPPGYQDKWQNDAIYVVQESAGQYIAYSLSCQHQGCQVQKSGSGWSCPCHGATFSATGAHTGGHSSANLQSYMVCADSTAVYITLA
jgi:Rieske Fe-S protein